MNDVTGDAWENEKWQIEVWKYYGNIGGADKNQMITIVTWLLTIAAGIVSLYATGKITVAESATWLFSVGAVVSLLAAFTALLYGGYAAWNWAVADRIAEKYDWKEQRPDFRPIAEAHWMDRLPLWLAQPCVDRVAPVFWIFFGAALVSLILNVALLVRSMY